MSPFVMSSVSGLHNVHVVPGCAIINMIKCLYLVAMRNTEIERLRNEPEALDEGRLHVRDRLTGECTQCKAIDRNHAGQHIW